MVVLGDSLRMAWPLGMRLPGPWPPSASPVRAKCPPGDLQGIGQTRLAGRDPTDTSSHAVGTQETLGGMELPKEAEGTGSLISSGISGIAEFKRRFVYLCVNENF